jgi:DNA-binding protein H-NS
MTDITKLEIEELTNCPLKDLLALQTRVNKAIEVRREKERQEIYQKINAIASESGFSLSELVSIKQGKTGNKPTTKAVYQNPNNKEQGWSGKGRKPNWMVELLEAGRKLEEFAI